MAIVGINPVAAPRPVEKDRGPSDFEKLMMGLQAAQSAFGIYIDYTNIDKNREEAELRGLEKQIKQKELEATPRRIEQEEDIRIEKGKKLKTEGDIKAIELARKKEERKFFESQDPLIRNVKTPAERKSMGLIALTYQELDTLEEALLGDIPINQPIGDNLATAARTRYTQWLGRYLTGAAMTDNPNFWKKIGIDVGKGGEVQQFQSMLPQMGDTPAAARQKIDTMKARLETMAITTGAPNRKEFLDFIGRTKREIIPLEKTPKTALSDLEQDERAKQQVKSIAKSVGRAIKAGTNVISEAMTEAFGGEVDESKKTSLSKEDQIKKQTIIDAITKFVKEDYQEFLDLFGPDQAQPQQLQPQPQQPQQLQPQPQQPPNFAPTPFQQIGQPQGAQGLGQFLGNQKRVIRK